MSEARNRTGVATARTCVLVVVRVALLGLFASGCAEGTPLVDDDQQCTDCVCGDGVCNGLESTATCTADCGSSCGDGVCSGSESTATCTSDCGAANNGVLSSRFGIVDVSGMNPLTGQLWAEGDVYRLAFVSSATRSAASNDPDDYNAWAKGLANAAGYGDVDWYVLGSYKDWDTGNNVLTYQQSTHTEPGVDSDSPQYRMDGSLFNSSFATLWGRNNSTTEAPLNINEYGELSDCGDVWVTGLGGWSGSLTTGVGRCHSYGNEEWLRVAGGDFNALRPLYVISELLTVEMR